MKKKKEEQKKTAEEEKQGLKEEEQKEKTDIRPPETIRESLLRQRGNLEREEEPLSPEEFVQRRLREGKKYTLHTEGRAAGSFTSTKVGIA